MTECPPALKTEQEVRDMLATKTFDFMVDGLAYWPVPCKACKGFHIITLPVRLERPVRAHA